MMIFRRYGFLLLCSAALSACAHRERPPLGDRLPFDQRLIQFQSLHNNSKIDELRLPTSLRMRPSSRRSHHVPASVEKYLSTLKAEPYQLVFNRTEVVYSLPRRAATRSDVVATATGRFNLRERVTVDWRVEDDYWRISRLAFSDWSPIVGSLATKRPGTGGIDRTAHSARRKLSCLRCGRLHGARSFVDVTVWRRTRLFLRTLRRTTRSNCKAGRGAISLCERRQESTSVRFRMRIPGEPSATKAFGYRLNET